MKYNPVKKFQHGSILLLIFEYSHCILLELLCFQPRISILPMTHKSKILITSSFSGFQKRILTEKVRQLNPPTITLDDSYFWLQHIFKFFGWWSTLNWFRMVKLIIFIWVHNLGNGSRIRFVWRYDSYRMSHTDRWVIPKPRSKTISYSL